MSVHAARTRRTPRARQALLAIPVVALLAAGCASGSGDDPATGQTAAEQTVTVTAPAGSAPAGHRRSPGRRPAPV